MVESRRRTVLLEQLHAKLAELSDDQLALVVEIAEAVARPLDSWRYAESDIASVAFVNSFSARLALFHAMHDAALTKKTFEYIFVGASRADGREASQIENDVHAGEDVVVDGVGFSLKTESGKSISPKNILISKLMEARWIRECRTGQDFASGLKETLQPHLQHYERILTLRSFKTTNSVRYELVEIPKPLLEAALSLTPDQFGRRTKAGGSSATVTDANNQKLFKLRLDGSVEKITISSLALMHCIVHAEWNVTL